VGPIPSHRQPADRPAQTESQSGTKPLDSIRSLVGAGETVEAIVESNGDPLVRESASGEEVFEPRAGERAVGVLTDRRIVLAAGTEDDPAVSIPYREVRAIDLDDLREPTAFSVTVEAATAWRLGVAPSARSDVKYGHRLVEKAIDCFEQIDEATTAVQAVRDDLVEPIADGDWATTRERYEQLRSTVDCARVGVENSPFDGVETFCDPLDRADATLEAAYVEATLRRVEKLRTVGREWLDDGDIERGAQAIETARESLEDVAERADSYNFVVEGDDATAVRLDSLSSPVGDATSVDGATERAHEQVDALAQRPLEVADSRRQRAVETGSIAGLEAALNRYKALLEIVWSDEETFGLDRASLQERVEATASEVIDLRVDIAEAAAAYAEKTRAEDRLLDAGDAYRTAVTHYERAHELATVYRAGEPEPIGDALDAVREARKTVPVRVTLREE